MVDRPAITWHRASSAGLPQEAGGPAAAPTARVHVAAPHIGAACDLPAGTSITFGRSTHADLSFTDEPRLSRLAGDLQAVDRGVVVTNRSTTHALVLHTAGERLRLPQLVSSQPESGLFVTGGVTELSGVGWSTSTFLIQISVRTDRPESEETSLPVRRGELTVQVLRLNPKTKEFMTALLLCRPRLDDSFDGPPTAPKVPVLARQIIEMTNSWHVLDTDPGLQRVGKQIHEHLRQLKDKLATRGIAAVGSPLSTDAVAGLLVDRDVVVRRHLQLLTDPEWLSWQETHWWT